MSAAQFVAFVVMPAATLWLQGCDVQSSIQGFIDTHAEAACAQICDSTTSGMMETYLAEAQVACQTDPDPTQCENCASNGLTDAKDSQAKQFIEECAMAAKNILNDTGAIETWANTTAPSFTASLNTTFQQVVANPSAYCPGAGTGVTRLFQALPRLPYGRKQRRNALILGCATLAFVSSMVFVVVRRSRRSIYHPQGDMEDALHDGTVDIE
jgi:hypothetical protein